jgi:hypothetical protein
MLVIPGPSHQLHHAQKIMTALSIVCENLFVMATPLMAIVAERNAG